MTSRTIALPACVVPDLAQEKVVDAALAGGFTACGFYIDPADWTDTTTKAVVKRAKDSGMQVIDVEVAILRPGPFTDDDYRYVDIALEVGAQNLIAMSWDPDLRSAGEKIRKLCERAKGELTIAIEFFPATQCKSLDMALEIIKSADHPSARVMVDAVHLDRSGGKPTDLAGVPAGLIDYIQISDVGPLSYLRTDYDSNRVEARDLRVMCGHGTLPLQELITCVPAQMPVSVELRSVAMVKAIPDAMERAEILGTSTRKFLSRIGR